jgi:hypothetical protein
LADEFAMRRADLTTFVDRETFIAGVAKNPDRTNQDPWKLLAWVNETIGQT